jgi:uncharacterized protein (TIGR00730 family)
MNQASDSSSVAGSNARQDAGDAGALQRPRSERDLAIDDFASRWLPGPNQDLYSEMMVTLCRMCRDEADRGDVKLMHKAIQELRYAFKIFAPYRETRKISIFGSARTPEDDPNYQQALTFSTGMCEHGWMTITGAGDGIMKAGHGGAGTESTFGVAIRLPFEQKTNTIIANDRKLINFRYFFTRKLLFIKEACAVALFPGGFGTQDEGFETLTLVQTGKAELMPIVMVENQRGTYWEHWRNYVETELLKSGMISLEDMDLFSIHDNAEAAVKEVVNFYRIYHSSRYVNDDLVLRLNQPIADGLLRDLNARFADILDAGAIEQTAALELEGGEYADKPRLVMRFNRKSHGKLRRMIDRINAET